MALGRPSLSLALTLAPIALLFALVARLGVDVPFVDEWYSILLIEKSFQGTLSFQDLWAQWGEHRQFFPKAVSLILARLSGWNIRWELAASLVFSLGAFLILAGQWQRARRSLKIAGFDWALPLFALIFFSLNQWPNWLWGIKLDEPLTLLALVAGVALLCSPPFQWSKFSAALLCGLIASYSFSSGLVFWPIGLALLLSAKRKSAAGLWAAASLLVIAAYALAYRKPIQHPPLSLPFEHPLRWPAFVFTALGAPLCSFSARGALGAGLLGVGLLAVLTRQLLARKVAGTTLAPFLALAAYAVACAGLMATGRLGFGVEAAMSAHYIALSNLLWLCDVALLALLMGSGGAAKYWAISAALISGLSLLSYAYGGLRFFSAAAQLRLLREELLNEDQERYVLPMRWPHEQEVGRLAALIKKRRLSLFRDPPNPEPDRPYTMTPGALEGQVSAQRIDGNRVEFAGWAADAARGEPAEFILVLVDGRLRYRGRTFSPSLDIAREFASPGLLLSGFEFIFPEERLTSANVRPRVQFLAVSKNGAASELPVFGK